VVVEKLFRRELFAGIDQSELVAKYGLSAEEFNEWQSRAGHYDKARRSPPAQTSAPRNLRLIIPTLIICGLTIVVVVVGNYLPVPLWEPKSPQSEQPKPQESDVSKASKTDPKAESLPPDTVALRKAEEIARKYYLTHSYSTVDLFVCVDMAIDVWNQLDTAGIKATLRVGSIDTDLTVFKTKKEYVRHMNHAWVMFRLPMGLTLPIETTTGSIVYPTDPLLNRYLVGQDFENPKRLKQFLEARTKYYEVCSEADIMWKEFRRKYPEKGKLSLEKTFDIVRDRAKYDQKEADCNKAWDEFNYTIK